MNKPGLLRFDALCIDQSNIEEKNVQVPLMGRVYSKAVSVLIWLGDTMNYEVRLAAQLITKHDKDDISDTFSKVKATHLIEFLWGMLQLVTRPYWNRM